MSNFISVFTDGGSRGNPGAAAFGAVIKKDGINIYAFGNTIGVTTNNVAEYTGILESFRWLYENRDIIKGISEVHFYMDSMLACQQLNGVYKIKKAHLAEMLIKIRDFERKIGVPVRYNHIPREKNKEADRLVNQALDNLR